jgi:hypothetical protein
MIVLNIQAKDQNINTQGWCNDAAVFLNSYCISMMRNRSLKYREKNCRRGRLGRGKQSQGRQSISQPRCTQHFEYNRKFVIIK